ncbi:mitochondrial import receptor subunit TOM5 homolog [Bubalus kerabau]|uniref:mitochondrial import receptor subunit TOM5 homolog n=1 Tax=Bubalus carabanensis TaxID=3119969 RepID=UPI00244EAC90|nr:mitochondrial import receptor subunit TOM5 homolog [Bubalus carabanensis]
MKNKDSSGTCLRGLLEGLDDITYLKHLARHLALFCIKSLNLKLDPAEKMRKDVISSARNFLIHVALPRVTPFILEKSDSLRRAGITCQCIM